MKAISCEQLIKLSFFIDIIYRFIYNIYMNYNYLKYFKVLAETEHYTHASEKLNISQPSLSHAMSELENELGVILFEKKVRNIRLTKNGKF